MVNSLIMIIVTAYFLNYLTLYKKNRLIGNISFIALSIAMIWAYDSNIAPALMLIFISFGNFLYDAIIQHDKNMAF